MFLTAAANGGHLYFNIAVNAPHSPARRTKKNNNKERAHKLRLLRGIVIVRQAENVFCEYFFANFVSSASVSAASARVFKIQNLQSHTGCTPRQSQVPQLWRVLDTVPQRNPRGAGLSLKYVEKSQSKYRI